jgi:taurine transport system substrate-binding protein
MNVFEDNGIEVVFKQFYSSSARMGALLTKDLAFASTGSISALALMSAGSRSFHLVCTQDSYETAEGIIVRSGIRSIPDLKGKKLAVQFASSAHVLVLDVLGRYGLDPRRDVMLINLKVSEMPAAFRTGEIDACALWTPMFHRVLELENAHLLLDVRDFSLYKLFGLGPGPDVVVVEKDFSRDNPMAARLFMKSYFESIALLRQQPTKCAKIITELTGLSLEEQIEVMRHVTWHGAESQKELMIDPGSFVSGLQRLAQFLKEKGQIDHIPDVRQWVDTSLIP